MLVVAVAAPLLAACPENRPAGETVAEDPRGLWYVNDPDSAAVIDHGPWDVFLKKYLRTGGVAPYRVDYDAVSADDRQALKDYLSYLGLIPIAEYNRDQQIAFWMNLYNAAIADMVLDSLPLNSVLQIRGPGFNVVGPWLRKVARIHNRPVSFNDIEHHILRPAFNDMDPPVHYGLNCASLGCPGLTPRAHTAENWRENLEATARQYINSEHGLRFEDGLLYTSKIYYSWFQEDFGGTDESVIDHLLRFAESELAEQLRQHSAIAGDFYDWRLNKPD